MIRRYHPVLVALHWILAALVILSLFMGGLVLAEMPNDDPDKIAGLTGHMTIGLAILVLMVLRLIIRVFTAKPPEADIGNPLLNRLGGWMHWALYALVLLMAASGLATANLAGLPDIVFGGSGAPLPESFDDIAPRAAHGILSTVLGLAILGHVLAALYHQFVRRDGLLARMWFGKRSG